MRMRCTTRRAVISGASATLLAEVGRVQAGVLPSGTVRILVGFPPGGGTDVMARIIAERLRQRGALRSVVVENKPGASGTLACESLVHAPTDGTTLMYAPSATTVLPVLTFAHLPYDPRRDFSPLTTTGGVPTVFAVAPGLGVRSVEEYVAWVSKDPRRASFGSTALGSNTHFFGLVLGKAFGVELEAVGYRGAAPLISDISGGHIAAGCGGITDFLQHHREGKLRIIISSSARHSTSAPEVQTVADLGKPEISSEGWYAMFAPPGTPRSMVEALSREFGATVMDAEAHRKLLELGLEPEVSTPEACARKLAEDIERWRPTVEASGFRVD